ncbi:phosphonate metabolism protein/1,5-bisphosphokinase (PRPP-forming) PhnN [Ruegeria arenilitoris]|uniref:phosphonate metabolism protein/1,5-bisphosphokinase (PRPP-forming) PhnN n=2 Tax=Ruegeria arenilitoris TaxID=1173585 RepID=UPI001479D27C|nr:phosphonate metabolism protein/1,5-bisphosphokinase (PRPP-forming) PhnN [Ruegeria arenilitoris]
MSLAPVIAIVGPSGVGKDSVIEALETRFLGYRRVRRVITRPEGEEGEDFDRVSPEAFAQMVLDGVFALNWVAHGLSYGIPKDVEAQRQNSDAVLVNLSRSVLLEAQQTFGNLIVISLTADAEVLAQRLLRRGRESNEEQKRRLRQAKAPLPQGLKQVFVVDNSGTLVETVDKILDRLQSVRA